MRVAVLIVVFHDVEEQRNQARLVIEREPADDLTAAAPSLFKNVLLGNGLSGLVGVGQFLDLPGPLRLVVIAQRDHKRRTGGHAVIGRAGALADVQHAVRSDRVFAGNVEGDAVIVQDLADNHPPARRQLVDLDHAVVPASLESRGARGMIRPVFAVAENEQQPPEGSSK